MRVASGTSSPTRFGASDVIASAVSPRAGIGTMWEDSFFQRTVRRALKPQTWSAPDL